MKWITFSIKHTKSIAPRWAVKVRWGRKLKWQPQHQREMCRIWATRLWISKYRPHSCVGELVCVCMCAVCACVWVSQDIWNACLFGYFKMLPAEDLWGMGLNLIKSLTNTSWRWCCPFVVLVAIAVVVVVPFRPVSCLFACATVRMSDINANIEAGPRVKCVRVCEFVCLCWCLWLYVRARVCVCVWVFACACERPFAAICVLFMRLRVSVCVRVCFGALV